ncbi:hypothetical protein ABZ924_17125 [Streptomyces sp. NPDC046876]|uniref:hypothetical protein n=1 Tax=Streptomyces sp. NPDC046876 TaxID=3155616 RepID=UPI0033F165E7
MTVRQIRAAARMIGRRNALRYLAIGVGASLVAACTGKDKAAAPPAGGPAAGETSAAPTSAAPSSAPSSAAPSSGAAASPTAAPPAPPAPSAAGPVARAFDAFIRGEWKVESTTPRGETVRGTATIRTDGSGNGGFTIVWDGNGAPVTWSGGWLQRGEHLRIDVYEAPQRLDRLTGGEALSIPAVFGDEISTTLPWQPPGAHNTKDGQQLQVTYRKNVLRIAHTERGGSESVHVCTRAGT